MEERLQHFQRTYESIIKLKDDLDFEGLKEESENADKYNRKVAEYIKDLIKEH